MRIKLDNALSIKAIASLAGGVADSRREEVINSICTDTREIMDGDLFIALRGNSFDGNDFLDEM